MADQRQDEMPLRECPFIFKACQGGKIEPIFQHGAKSFFVNCSCCGARGPIAETLDMAISAWNRQSATLTPDQVETVRRALEDIVAATINKTETDRNIVYGCGVMAKKALALLPQGEKK